MGQKVHPTGLRLGITETWRARWYADKKTFSDYLVEDQRIRKHIKAQYGFAGITKIETERTRDTARVVIHAASPGLLIGRKGAKVDQLTQELEGILGRKVDLKILEVKRPELCAQLVAEGMAEQLKRRAPYRRTMRKFCEATMGLGARGIKARVSGRIAGAEIARVEKMGYGSIPLHTLRADIDYGFAEAVLPKGKIGIKVWIFKQELHSPTKETRNAADAKAGQVP